MNQCGGLTGLGAEPPVRHLGALVRGGALQLEGVALGIVLQLRHRDYEGKAKQHSTETVTVGTRDPDR